MRRILLSLALLLALAPVAAAEHVPEVYTSDLPVAGTCAPLPASDLTWVFVGDMGWYRVDDDLREIQDDELVGMLAARARAAADAGREHEVWLVAGRERGWGSVVKVLHACQRVGIYRVGLQVQSESGDGVMGFPLFLPRADAPGAGTGARARRLPVRLETSSDGPPSHPSRLYAAAQVAVQRFGPIVAELSVAPNATVQSAITAMDVLYRAGVASVTMRYRLVVPSMSVTRPAQVWIQDAPLPAEPMDVDIPPIRPRKAAWGEHGAEDPLATTYVLEEMPGAPGAGGGDAETTPDAFDPLPSYAATGQPVPAAARAAAEVALLRWNTNLGASLTAVLERNLFPEGLLVRRKRLGMEADRFFHEARRAFPRIEAIVPSTIRVQAYLFKDSAPVGKVDLTLGVVANTVGVVWGRWVVEDLPQGLTLPPRETDPWAAGVPGQLRVWVEAVLADARLRGVDAIPLTPEAAVLQELPLVAHESVRPAIAARKQGLDVMAQWLRATPYDRILFVQPEGSAGVHVQGTVAGILRYDLESEERMLRLSSLHAKVAPR